MVTAIGSSAGLKAKLFRLFQTFQAMVVVTVASGVSRHRVRRRSGNVAGSCPGGKWLKKFQISRARGQVSRKWLKPTFTICNTLHGLSSFEKFLDNFPYFSFYRSIFNSEYIVKCNTCTPVAKLPGNSEKRCEIQYMYRYEIIEERKNPLKGLNFADPLPSSSCYFKFSSYHLAVLRVVGGK
jgi:hypothetical protein